MTMEAAEEEDTSSVVVDATSNPQTTAQVDDAGSAATTRLATDPTVPLTSSLSNNIVLESRVACGSTTAVDERRVDTATANAAVEGNQSRGNRDAERIVVPVEDGKEQAKTSNEEECDDAAAIVPEEEMGDVTIQPNDDDDGSQLATLRNSVSRLNAKFQALGAPPRSEELLQLQETADHVTRTAAMKMHQLAALDPNKEPISVNPVEFVQDESESTIDPGFVVVETEEQAVAFTPHVYADALVVEEAARETSTSRDAFPDGNETDMSLPVYSEKVPSNGHKRLSRRQRIGGVVAAIILAHVTSTKTNAILQYINNITLTGRTIEGPTSILPNGPPEDLALKWLSQGDLLNFTLDSPSHRFRLQQRYALATMWVENKEQIDDGSSRHECEWYGVTCQAMDWGAEIGTQLTVTEIYIRAAAWKGALSEDLGLLSSMVSFDVQDNLLTGTLPNSIGAWTNMTLFDVYLNDFSGTLPSSYRHWTKLTYFQIVGRGDGLAGTVPDLFANWTNLDTFVLVSTKITGPFPSSIGQLTTLRFFDVQNNDLNGPLPSMQSTRFDTFLVQLNRFTGTIPTPTSNLTYLLRAVFQKNLLTGSMPIEFCYNVSRKEQFALEADCQSEIVCECCTACE